MTFTQRKKTQAKWWQNQLLDWFATSGRHDLPWQINRNAYRVWVAEIMLQQTQVATVIPYYNAFMAHFPSLQALAQATQDEVLSHWSGLGYYARGRNLHKAAQIAYADNKALPKDADALIALPGIGQSTAHAILAQSDNQPLAILDGNVKRVLSRFHGIREWPELPAVKKELWVIADHYMPTKPSESTDYTQAIMDLGATCCTRSRPNCTQCPFAKRCYAHQHQLTATLPGKKPKKPKPIRQKVYVYVKHQDTHLMYKRPDSGIWGGMWCLPEFEDDISAKHWLKTNRLQVNKEIVIPTLRHEFTHFSLDYHAFTATLQRKRSIDNFEWLSHQQASQKGLPRPISILLSQFSN